MTTKQSHPGSARPLLSIPETAEWLGVSVATVRRMIARGEIPALRIGPRLVRIDPDDVKKFAPVTPTAAYRAATAAYRSALGGVSG